MKSRIQSIALTVPGVGMVSLLAWAFLTGREQQRLYGDSIGPPVQKPWNELFPGVPDSYDPPVGGPVWLGPYRFEFPSINRHRRSDIPFIFDLPQQTQIEALYQQGLGTQQAPGAFSPMYDYINNVLITGSPPPITDPEVKKAQLWFSGAKQANSGHGPFATLIREYTQNQQPGRSAVMADHGIHRNRKRDRIGNTCDLRGALLRSASAG